MSFKSASWSCSYDEPVALSYAGKNSDLAKLLVQAWPWKKAKQMCCSYRGHPDLKEVVDKVIQNWKMTELYQTYLEKSF